MNQIKKKRRRALRPLVDVDLTTLTEEELAKVRAALGIDLDRINDEVEIYRVKLIRGAVINYFPDQKKASSFLKISLRQFRRLVEDGKCYKNYTIETGYWDAGLIKSGLGD